MKAIITEGKTFVLNGTTYNTPELNFNAVSELESMGISLIDKKVKIFNTIRGFVALVVGNLESAGNQIEAHLLAGGSLDELWKALDYAMVNSGFFQAMAAKGETPNP